ncbi:MAG TPA: DUF2255 family protein [Candidatus Dormibacteraeota bacterium]|nr:DUF2255 family protein [Candidatus Dormibacteraeota bacterium]
MSGFDRDLLQRLEREREVRVRTRRQDGSTTDLPIWVVTVDGEPYVRSYRAERGAWYRRARAEGRLTLVVGDRTVPVLARPVADEELNQRVSTAFTAKYGEGGPARTMVSPAVAATTLRLAPAG